MTPATPLLSDRLEEALRWAAVAHHGQVRRGSDVPYFEHVVAVAMILLRAGFSEEVVIAGTLHDIVEDTPVTLDQVETRFGTSVSTLVGYCSEVKNDPEGKKRPWVDRKADHLKTLEAAPYDARAIVLADKLHNLISIRSDLAVGRDIWSQFNASKPQVLDYYRKTLEVCGTHDPRLAMISDECRAILNAVSGDELAA